MESPVGSRNSKKGVCLGGQLRDVDTDTHMVPSGHGLTSRIALPATVRLKVGRLAVFNRNFSAMVNSHGNSS